MTHDKNNAAAGNLYRLENRQDLTAELFEKIIEGRDIKIERIVSKGHVTAEGEWYDQELDEWVVLLQGEAVIQYRDKTEKKLNSGDYLFIESHVRHRVSYTSSDPVCIWLTVHGKFTI